MKPLDGVIVIELSTMITASFAAMMMAEQGAQVIKVEPTEMGDPMRYIGSAKGGISALFANCNRGKQSIRVNLKDTKGQALVQQLATSADVLIHNFRPGVMDKLGLGSDQLRQENSRLIYMAISGFGPDGPMSTAPAYDPVIQAQTGMTASQGTALKTLEDPEPQSFIRNLMCDKITAYTACQAVTSGLYMREKTGEGQHIDLSMLDSGLFFMFPDAYMNNTLLDDDVAPQPLLSDVMYQITQTKDGGITMSAATDSQRHGVLKSVDKLDLLQDERFNSLEGLMANMVEYRALLADAFLELTTSEALERLQQNDVPCAKCLSLEEVLAQSQLAVNESIETVEHPLMGSMRLLRAPPRFGGQPLVTGTPAPAHGEHTVAVLLTLGKSETEIGSLVSNGVVA